MGVSDTGSKELADSQGTTMGTIPVAQATLPAREETP